jgi:ethanolaminephosphotransferase
LRAYLVFAVIVYFRWALLVINAICGYLGIQCLRIMPKDPPAGVLNGIPKERAA